MEKEVFSVHPLFAPHRWRHDTQQNDTQPNSYIATRSKTFFMSTFTFLHSLLNVVRLSVVVLSGIMAGDIMVSAINMSVYILCFVMLSVLYYVLLWWHGSCHVLLC
jgi:hypothetical protein